MTGVRRGGNIAFQFSRGLIDMEDFEKQTLVDHLTDLRHCLVVSLIAVAIGFAVSYSFIREIGEYFFQPLFRVLPEHSSLIFTSYQEAFFFI